MKKNYMYIEIIIYLKKLSKDKATKIQELLEKDRNSRISNVREAKYNIQENIDIYEKYINEMI